MVGRVTVLKAVVAATLRAEDGHQLALTAARGGTWVLKITVVTSLSSGRDVLAVMLERLTVQAAEHLVAVLALER